MRKLVILTSDDYIRNYLETDAFSEIDDENCYIAVSHKVTEDLSSRPRYIGRVNYSAQEIIAHTWLTNILMVRSEHLSKSFRYRFDRMVEWATLPLNPYQIEATERFRRTLGILRKTFPTNMARRLTMGVCRILTAARVTRTLAGILALRVLAQPFVFDKWLSRFEARTPPNAELAALLGNLKPDLVLLPSSAVEAVGRDLIRLKPTFKQTNLFLIDNWDNLSSKSVYLVPPDYLGVWGHQSLEHAMNIHGISEDRIEKIGTPRFEPYYEVLQGRRESVRRYAFPYILFVGCAVAFDEIECLEHLDRCLDSINAQRRQSGSEDLRLIYRPHPVAQGRRVPWAFEPEKFRNVVLCQQIAAFLDTGDRAMPKDLDYYASILFHSEFVVGPLTTMLLEASIFQKRVLALAYEDGLHLTSPAQTLKRFLHFEHMDEVEGISFCHDLASLPEQFSSLAQEQRANLDPDKHQQTLGYFLHHDQRPYCQRLKTLVDKCADPT